MIHMPFNQKNVAIPMVPDMVSLPFSINEHILSSKFNINLWTLSLVDQKSILSDGDWDKVVPKKWDPFWIESTNILSAMQ